MSGGVLFYVFSRPDIHLSEILKTFKACPREIVFFCILIYGVVFLLACVRWWMIMRVIQIRLGLLQTIRLALIGAFFNNMMPSLTGGDIIKAYYLAGTTDRKVEAVSSIALDRMCGFAAVFLLGAVASFFALSDVHFGSAARSVVILSSVFFLVILFLFFAASLRNFSWFSRMLSRFKVMAIIKRAYETITILKHHPMTGISVLFISVVLQSLLVYLQFLFARSIGVTEISWERFFLIIPMASVISAIPISFAGWGIGEGAYRSLFMIANPALGAVAVSISIFFKLVCLMYSLIGLPFYLTYKHQKLDRGRDGEK